jgi:hypothetical protein
MVGGYPGDGQLHLASGVEPREEVVGTLPRQGVRHRVREL